MKERLGGWSSLELKRLCYAGRFSLPGLSTAVCGKFRFLSCRCALG
jgi:hypothetical protein